MKNKETFLQLHHKFIRDGLDGNGLCVEEFNGYRLDHHVVFKLLLPSEEDLTEHAAEGKLTGFWGEDRGFWFGKGHREIGIEYTPLRQNIILLCAAINNEL